MSFPPRTGVGRREILGACAGILVLAGCSAIGPVPYQLYTLHPATAPATEAPSVSWQLAIGVPDAPANLDTSRIALSQSSTTMDYFANAAWTDRATTLVQSFLVEAFENSHKVKSVSRDISALHAEYLLQTELRDFQAEYAHPGAAPQVMVRIKSKLVKLPEREIVGSFSADKTVQAQANKLDSIVTAFDEALGATLQQTVDWTLRTAPAPESPKPEHPHKVPRAKSPQAAPAPEPPPAAAPAKPAQPAATPPK